MNEIARSAQACCQGDGVKLCIFVYLRIHFVRKIIILCVAPELGCKTVRKFSSRVRGRGRG